MPYFHFRCVAHATFDRNLIYSADACFLVMACVGYSRAQLKTLSSLLKQTERRRRQEWHLKMWPRVSAIIFQLFKLIMLEKRVLTILEFNWNQRLGHKQTKLNICHHMLTSSTQLQTRSFHVVERTRTSSKCQKMKNARAKRAKILFSIVKYANLWGFCCRRRRGCLSSLLSQVRWIVSHKWQILWFGSSLDKFSLRITRTFLKTPLNVGENRTHLLFRNRFCNLSRKRFTHKIRSGKYSSR